VIHLKLITFADSILTQAIHLLTMIGQLKKYLEILMVNLIISLLELEQEVLYQDALVNLGMLDIQ
jgi:hypothetical protein